MSIDRMAACYGFTRPPFGKDLPCEALHRHAGHAQAVARLRWVISARSIGVLTGEVGAGKTVSVRAALADLDPARHSVIYLANPTIGAAGIHHVIVQALGQRPRYHRAALVPQTAALLAAETEERGRHVVLVIDEAHLLDSTQLEAVRMMTNARYDALSPLAVLLIGQPTLRHRLKLGDMAAIDQRVALRYHLVGMNNEETTAYINHHLQHAGRTDALISQDAIDLIHQTARGIPRAINNLCLLALITAYTTDKTIVDHECARTAIAEYVAPD